MAPCVIESNRWETLCLYRDYRFAHQAVAKLLSNSNFRVGKTRKEKALGSPSPPDDLLYTVEPPSCMEQNFLPTYSIYRLKLGKNSLTRNLV